MAQLRLVQRVILPALLALARNAHPAKTHTQRRVQMASIATALECMAPIRLLSTGPVPHAMGLARPVSWQGPAAAATRAL